ncbi:unnamed protein product [Xylocopa violacea]|uniref:Uncharacterized protein n=1 Tax=Xylocopa violacea TaxID=135666 RepID=A0ABP1NMI8_XYLVO
MEETIKCSVNDCKQNQKSPHIFNCHKYELGYQSIEKNDTTYTIPKEQDYFNERNIFDIFHFLLCHLIVHQPTDPIQYLHRLLDDCILFRSGLRNPPLLWTEKHVDAIFKSVAPFDSELLSLDGYKTAMKILGVRFFDPCPVQLISGHINRRSFCTEALNNMESELMRLVNGTN